MQILRELAGIYRQYDKCGRCAARKNPLRHILGGGKMRNPRFAFVLINPTYRNLSAHESYKGKRRYPNIGVVHFWEVLAKGGFVDPGLVRGIREHGWQIADEYRIEKSLARNGVYLTNLVKCAEAHGDNPSLARIMEQFPVLEREIDTVRPKYIVAFGLLPIKTLTSQYPKISDIWKGMGRGRYKALRSVPIGGRVYDVLPCYFPIGRGNPKRAVEMLRFIKRKYGG